MAEPPPVGVVHLALITTQLIFGGGAVVGKFGVHGTNPALFALIREGVAGPILCFLAYLQTRVLLPARHDMPRILAAGFAIFSNQFFFILGDKLGDPLTASAWQPSQPIFTLILAILVGYEKLSVVKSLGIAFAVTGAIVMVVFGSTGSDAGTSGASLQLSSHVMFFLNCFGTSCYVIISKGLLKRYQSSSVTGWAYLCGSIMMFVTVYIINSAPVLISFVCQTKESAIKDACVKGAWSVPMSMVWPLLYWICFNSIVAYFLMTWGNQYAKASVVSAYSVLQPVTSGLISALLIAIKGNSWASAYGFTPPGWQDLGIIGIILGLAFLFSERTLQVGEARECMSVTDSSLLATPEQAPSSDVAKPYIP